MTDQDTVLPGAGDSEAKATEDVLAAVEADAAALTAPRAPKDKKGAAKESGEAKKAAGASVGDYHVRLPSAPKGNCSCALYTQYRDGKGGAKERDSMELRLVDGVPESVATLNGNEAPEGYCPGIEDLLAAGFVRF